MEIIKSESKASFIWLEKANWIVKNTQKTLCVGTAWCGVTYSCQSNSGMKFISLCVCKNRFRKASFPDHE